LRTVGAKNPCRETGFIIIIFLFDPVVVG
jgi:hypothetical protein